MPYSYNSPFTNPFTQVPKPPQPISNRDWATGATAWDPKNIFTTKTTPTPGIVAGQPETWNFQMRANPTAGVVNEPNTGMVAEQAPNPWAMPNTFQDMGANSQPVAESMPNPWSQPQQQAPAYPMDPGYQPGAFQTQYATLENLQPYMNPFLDQIIDRGNRAIQSSAAARGLLGSSATLNNIGDWTAQAQANAHNDARNAFGADRGYMTDQYWNSRNADYQNYRDTNKWNYNLFQDQYGDWKTRLGQLLAQMSDISNTGQNAANNVANIYSNQGAAIAALHGDRGNLQATSAMNSGQSTADLISGIISLLSSGGG